MRELLILGCSGSAGVPLIGCGCKVCTSSHPRNRRTRTSCLLRSEKSSILVDIGPDFRQQALREKIETTGEKSVHGLFLTHLHYDHIAGLDEIRLFNFRQKKPMPLLASQTHKEGLLSRFPYIFNKDGSPSACDKHSDTTLKKNYAPSVDPIFFPPSEKGPVPIEFCGWSLKIVRYFQGVMEVSGLIVGSVAYLPDIKDYPDWLTSALHGIETLVIGAHSFEKNPLQLNVEEAASFGRECGAKEVVITHMGHDIDYENASVPDYVSFAYDGRIIEIK